MIIKRIVDVALTEDEKDILDGTCSLLRDLRHEVMDNYDDLKHGEKYLSYINDAIKSLDDLLEYLDEREDD